MSSEEISQRRKAAMEILQKRRNQPVDLPSTSIPKASSFYGNSPIKQISLTHSNVIVNKPFPVHLFSPYRKKPEDDNQVKKETVWCTICTCSLISATRFAIITSLYNAKLVEMFQKIPSKVYDPKTRNWNFLLKDYDLIQTKSRLIEHVIIDRLPKFVLDICNQSIKKSECSQWIKCLGAPLQAALMPFQKEGFYFGIQRNGRVLIADEMGLGKTYQALAIADFYRDDFPMLICTTAITRDVWSTKIRLLLPYIPCHQIVTLTSSQDYFGEAKVLISSYALMDKNANKFLEKKFGILIFDESHTIKNSKSKCTAVATNLAKLAKRVILLSGTPALSRPVELFTQIKLIDTKFVNYKEYTRRYCEGHETEFGWNATGQANLTELNIILRKKYMIRRVKDDVISQLAAKYRETIILDPALILENEENIYKLKTLSAHFSSSSGRERETALLQYYSETGKIKTKAVCSYLKGLIKEKIKFIIFAHHLVMLDAITECLMKSLTDFIRIDGSTSQINRTNSVNRFQNEESCLVAVLSLKACNSGITLTATQLVVFAELDWNPTTLAQAESRAHRIGQEGIVTVRYLLAQGTADDIIWEKIINKQGTLNKAGLCNDDFSDATMVNVSKDKNTSNEQNDTLLSLCDAIPTTSRDSLQGNEFQNFLNADDEYFSMTQIENMIQTEETVLTPKNSTLEFKGLLEDDADEDLLNLMY